MLTKCSGPGTSLTLRINPDTPHMLSSLGGGATRRSRGICGFLIEASTDEDNPEH